MKAAVCREFGAPLVIEDLELRPPGPGEVEVAMTATAICHSDITKARGGWGGDLPAVLGHEGAGVVAAIGPGVTTIVPGDRVVVTLIRSCGRCRGCQRGMPVTCDATFPLDQSTPLSDASGQPVGQGLRTAAFAERVVVHESQIAPIPASIPLDAAALLSCGVITGFGAVVNTARIEPGSDVVIIGAGGVGLNAVQGARIAGARVIVAVDVAATKLATARTFGATHTADAARDVVSNLVLEATAGRGADYVFVTVGAAAAYDQSYSLLAKGGAVVLVGMAPNGVTSAIDPTTIADQSQRILGSKMGSTRLGTDIAMLVSLYEQGRLLLDELITGRYRLDQINEAIDDVVAGNAVRNVIMFDEIAEQR